MRYLKPVCMMAAAVLLGVAAHQAWQTMSAPPRDEQLAEVGFHRFPAPRSLRPFQLQDSNQRPFGLEQLQERWTILFFGYTFCPDICPTTLAKLVRMQSLLYEEGFSDETQFILVSVDPARDTPQRLESYLDYFDPDFIGLTGEEDQLAAFAAQLSSVFIRNPGHDARDYQVDHSSHIVLIDPQGRFAGFFRTPHDPNNLALGYQMMKSSR